MMDDKTRERIKECLPNSPDPELKEDEYYYLQSTMQGEKVIKVRVMSLFPGEPHQPMEYEIYQVRSNGLRWVNVGWDDHFRGAYMSQLYDNKEDCRNQTHQWVEDWEDLRRIQREEQNA